MIDAPPLHTASDGGGGGGDDDNAVAPAVPTSPGNNESTIKRKRHPYHTPRKTKLRKLNASLMQFACQQHQHAPPGTVTRPPRRHTTSGSILKTSCKLLVAILIVYASAVAFAPTLHVDLLDMLHYCRRHFEHEFNALVHDTSDGGSASAADINRIDPLAATMRQLHALVAHQNNALSLIERVLRNHSTSSAGSPAALLSATALISAMALIGGSGTGKTLSVGVLTRDWLTSSRGNVLHFVWSAATEPLHQQDFYAQAGQQMSRYESNLLVIDSIPARHHRDILQFHRELVAGVSANRYANLLVVYVINVPTFGAADVQQHDTSVAEVRESVEAAASPTGIVVPVVFEAIATAEQLRECIERERLRLRLAAVSEEDVQLIGAGIDVRQSGCKHVGARMSMYL